MLIPMLLVLDLLDAARISTLLPLHADRVLSGPSAFGAMIGVFGAVAFAGSILAGRVAHRLPRRLIDAVAFARSRAARRSSHRRSAPTCRG